jgi:hypothetical protein
VVGIGKCEKGNRKIHFRQYETHEPGMHKYLGNDNILKNINKTDSGERSIIRLMLFRKIDSVYCENHTKHTNTLCGLNLDFRHLKIYGTYSDHWDLKG